MQGFADRLKQAIEASGLPRKDVAERAGIAQSRLSEWTTFPDADPPFSRVVALADALGVSLDHLAGRED